MNYKIDKTKDLRVRANSEIKLKTSNINVTIGYPRDASIAGIIKDMMVYEYHNSGEEGLREILNDVLKMVRV